MKKIVLGIILVLLSTSVMAEMVVKKGLIEGNIVDGLDELVIKYPGIRCNNFSISEGTSMFSAGLTVLKITGSVKNKTEETKHLGIIMMGIGKDNRTKWSVNIEPDFDMVSKKKTSELKGDTYVEPGAFKATTYIAWKLIGN